MSKKLVSLVLALLMIISIIPAVAENGAFTVTDMFGREVTIPGPVTRIVAMEPGDCEILCALGCALGFGSLNSACNVMACQTAPMARRSYCVTTFYLCCDIAMGFGPALLGTVTTATGSYPIMYIVSAGLTLLALPLFLVIDRRR